MYDDNLSDIDILETDNKTKEKAIPLPPVTTPADDDSDDFIDTVFLDAVPGTDKPLRREESLPEQNVPVFENLDGTEVNEEEEKKAQEELYSRIFPSGGNKERLYDNIPDEPVDTDQFGVYADSDKGRQIVKAIAILVAVMSSIGFIYAAFKGRGPSAMTSLIRLVCSYFMLKGKNLARLLVMLSLVISAYSDIILLIYDTESSMIMQAFYIVMFLIHTAMCVILWKSDEVRTYFGK